MLDRQITLLMSHVFAPRSPGRRQARCFVHIDHTQQGVAGQFSCMSKLAQNDGTLI